MLLFNFLSQAYCLTTTFATLIFFSILLTSSSIVSANKCVVKGTYLDIQSTRHSQKVTMLANPKQGVLEEVGNKQCGFRITGYDMHSIACDSNKLVEFVAVETNSNKSFCSFWEHQTICVCEFYGCNSVDGVLYETILSSMYSPRKKVIGEDYNPKAPYHRMVSPETDAWLLTECIMRHIEYLFNDGKVADRQEAYVYMDTPNAVELIKFAVPQFFPNEEKVEKMKAEGKRMAARTQPSAQTTPAPSAVAAQAAALTSGKVSAKKKPEEESFGVVPLVITVVLFVVVLALVAAMIIAFICFRRKVNDNLTTIRSVASDTSLHNSMYLVPNTSAAADYGIAPSVPVAPAQQSGMAVPSTTSKSSARAGTSPINKSLVAAPNPAPVSRK